MLNNWTGEVIRAPGMYSEIPIETYHQNPFLCDGPSISSSGLKSFIERPSLYWAFSPYNSNQSERPDKPHFSHGQAAHSLLLGEGDFDRRFTVRPETYPSDESKKWNANSKDCKAWLENQASLRKSVLTPNDMLSIEAIARKLEQKTEVQQGILEGLTETTMVVKVNGVWLRSRPDKIPVHSGDFVDLKMTVQTDYDGLEKSIYNFGYHIQGAVCRMVWRQLQGADAPFSFALVFCEKSPPHDIWIHQLSDQALDLGEQQIRLALQYFNRCIERWQWPSSDGFDPIITQIGMPAWVTSRIHTRLEYIKQEVIS